MQGYHRFNRRRLSTFIMAFNKTFNPKFLSIIVHELEPKKNGYLVPVGKQNIIQLQRVDFLEKCDELSEWVAFGQKLKTRPVKDQRGDHMKMNFEYFQITINITNS